MNEKRQKTAVFKNFFKMKGEKTEINPALNKNGKIIQNNSATNNK